MNNSEGRMDMERMLQEANRTPAPAREFVDVLRARISGLPAPTADDSLKRRPVARRLWITAGVTAGILLTTVIVAGPERVAALIRGVVGYLPGMGFLQESASTLVLMEPVSAGQQDLVVTVMQAVADPIQVKMKIRVHRFGSWNLQKDPLEHGPWPLPVLRFADGTEIGMREDYFLIHEDPSFEIVGVFPPLPSGVRQVTLIMDPVFPFGRAGEPQMMEIPLQFQPLTPGSALPVIDTISNEAYPEVAPLSKETTGTFASQAGVDFRLERVVPADGKYILMGSYRWSNPDWSSVHAVGDLNDELGLTAIGLTDANGRQISYEPYLAFDEFTPSQEKGINQWVIVTEETDAPGPWTFSVSAMRVTIEPHNLSFSLDPGGEWEDGRTMALEQALDLNGYPARIISARWHPVDGSEEEMAMELDLCADPRVLKIELGEATVSIGGSQGNQNRKGEANDILWQDLYFQPPLPDVPLRIDVVSYAIQLDGAWIFTWQPPNGSSSSDQGN